MFAKPGSPAGHGWLLGVEDNCPGLPPGILSGETGRVKGDSGARVRMRFEAGPPAGTQGLAGPVSKIMLSWKPWTDLTHSRNFSASFRLAYGPSRRR
jgi:hypothetical protein